MSEDRANDSVSVAPQAMTAKPLRFSLRELFIFTGLVCLAGGFFSMARAGSYEAVPFFYATALATFVFVIYVATRWSATAIAVVAPLLLLFGCCLIGPGGTGHPKEASHRMQCSSHLKQIGLALQNYHDTYGCLPPAYVADAKGRPMHSWRVLILPFMEQKPLYDKYRFDEPWDGPNNSKLHNEIVEVFCCPSRPKQQARTETSYVAVIGPQTAWPGEKATKLSDFKDGTSNTLFVVELANSGIHWMEPRDLHVVQMPMAVNPERGQGISSPHRDCALAVFVDGHTQAITKNIPPETLRALLTVGGGEKIGDY